MQASLLLGNDVVDLRSQRNIDSAANPRFIKRVFAPNEQEVLENLAHCHQTLWALWAAKETAYKALIKRLPGLVFSHRKFVVGIDKLPSFSGQSGSSRGTVTHDHRQVDVVWTWTNDWVHCLSNKSGDTPIYKVRALSDLCGSEAFINLKKSSALPEQSVAARILALSLLDMFGVTGVQIIRSQAGRRQGPPRLVRDGETLPNVGISLSHDARYAAAAICIDEANGGMDISGSIKPGDC